MLQYDSLLLCLVILNHICQFKRIFLYCLAICDRNSLFSGYSPPPERIPRSESLIAFTEEDDGGVTKRFTNNNGCAVRGYLEVGLKRTRNPTSMIRFSGFPTRRSADRQSAATQFQEPPRTMYPGPFSDPFGSVIPPLG